MASTKPKLAQLQTPSTSTFPSELSALSARSPLPGFADFIKAEDSIKTPITPPIAYIDFLKSMASPVTGDKLDKSSGRTTPTSAPSTSSSEHSDCSCNCEIHKSPASTASTAPSTKSFVYPSSAPASARLGRLRIPPSPIFSATESPLSATSAVRSPFSARSARSPFDWSFSSKGRYFDAKSPKTRSSVRQVREIVTRTVTYTPRMSPAPKGKRRKIE
ncbi:hypothetical protein B7463_g11068, partial [Scytalidium lignicola]